MLSIGVNLLQTFQKNYFLTNVFLLGGLMIGTGSAFLLPTFNSVICALSDGKASS